jgi:molybdopterin-containing oxidoreductase family iron-sulfur binding subunit
MMACKVENGTPAGHFYMYTFRFEEGEFPHTKFRYLPRPCMHCENPPCVAACPVNSRIKWKDGIVATDVDNCQGLRLCEAACPYGVNYFNIDDPAESQYLNWENTAGLGSIKPPYWKPELDEAYSWSANDKKQSRRVAGSGHRRNTVGKCTFCVHRLEKGKTTTACQAACPVGAISFGDLDVGSSPVSQALAGRESDVFRLKEELGTNPKVYYLGRPPAESVHLVELVSIKEGVQALGTDDLKGGTLPWK